MVTVAAFSFGTSSPLRSERMTSASASPPGLVSARSGVSCVLREAPCEARPSLDGARRPRGALYESAGFGDRDGGPGTIPARLGRPRAGRSRAGPLGGCRLAPDWGELMPGYAVRKGDVVQPDAVIGAARIRDAVHALRRDVPDVRLTVP